MTEEKQRHFWDNVFWKWAGRLFASSTLTILIFLYNKADRIIRSPERIDRIETWEATHGTSDSVGRDEMREGFRRVHLWHESDSVDLSVIKQAVVARKPHGIVYGLPSTYPQR